MVYKRHEPPTACVWLDQFTKTNTLLNIHITQLDPSLPRGKTIPQRNWPKGKTQKWVTGNNLKGDGFPNKTEIDCLIMGQIFSLLYGISPVGKLQ